jgi:DNA polymerase IV (DinB-like DNA polymerase)
MGTLNLSDIHGIGKKTVQKLAEEGIKTISQAKNLDIFILIKMFGRKAGTYIYNAIRGIDDDPVKIRAPTLQLSKITTLKEDSVDYTFLEKSLFELCEKLHPSILKGNKMFRTVGIYLTQSNLSSKTRSKMLRNPTSSLDELKKASSQLLKDALKDQSILIRRLGVKVSELSDIEGQSNITSYF